MKLHCPPGATPLEPDDQENLIAAVTTQEELDRAEARNITKAIQWSRGNARLRKELLTVSGLLRLHDRMFGETWRWAGRYRNKNTNIGVDFQSVKEGHLGAIGFDPGQVPPPVRIRPAEP